MEKVTRGKKQSRRLFILTSGFCLLTSVLLPGQENATDRLIRSRQLRVKMYPQDAAGYDNLGTAYIQKGRETGDATYYELAQQALNKSLDLLSDDPAAASATTHLAVVYMAEHRFDDALTWAQNALALGSGDLTPWAIVVDALTDVGEYDKALAYCSRLEKGSGAEDAQSGLSYERNTRLSYLRFIFGDAQGAVELMRRAIATAVAVRMPRENIAWSQYQLGEELFKVGDLKDAEAAYQGALTSYPGYYRALAGLAAVREAQARYSEAIELYRRAIAVVPYPIYVAALGDVYAKVSRPEEAKKQYDLVEFIGELNAINKVLYNRELALFYADHDMKLKDALALARKELEVRHDVYTWDTLAWALHKNGQPHEAADAMTKALKPGTKDAMLLFHAGMICDRLGRNDKAREYLGRALALNARFHIFYADLAARILEDLRSQKLGVRSQETLRSKVDGQEP
ncbi:MAG: hypothetical protein DMG27_04520 [Acidobacteria bacterium]|nr:MAG: hypothetical protein DMG27_04520 [Acidobacteriota bacterium]